MNALLLSIQGVGCGISLGFVMYTCVGMLRHSRRVWVACSHAFYLSGQLWLSLDGAMCLVTIITCASYVVAALTVVQ